jgi:hypothetical protein
METCLETCLIWMDEDVFEAADADGRRRESQAKSIRSQFAFTNETYRHIVVRRDKRSISFFNHLDKSETICANEDITDLYQLLCLLPIENRSTFTLTDIIIPKEAEAEAEAEAVDGGGKKQKRNESPGDCWFWLNENDFNNEINGCPITVEKSLSIYRHIVVANDQRTISFFKDRQEEAPFLQYAHEYHQSQQISLANRHLWDPSYVGPLAVKITTPIREPNTEYTKIWMNENDFSTEPFTWTYPPLQQYSDIVLSKDKRTILFYNKGRHLSKAPSTTVRTEFDIGHILQLKQFLENSNSPPPTPTPSLPDSPTPSPTPSTTDAMLLWLDNFIKTSEFATTADFTAKTLVKHYNAYCVDHDNDPLTALSFGKIFKNRIDLDACDIVKRRSNGDSVYRIHKDSCTAWLQYNI